MIELQPFTGKHLEHFPIPGLPLDFWEEKAVTVLKDGEVIGIAGARQIGDTAYVGIIGTPELREHPLFLCKAVLKGMDGLRRMGVRYLRAHAETDSGARWLEWLGFELEGDWYVKCLG